MDAVLGFSGRRKVSKAVGTLSEIDVQVDWRDLAEIVSVLDKTQTGKGGRPPIGFEIKLKMMFLQHIFNLSDEELEDQLIDRMSFQQFVGLSYNEEIPDFTTIWKFKEALVKASLMDGIFNAILSQLEAKGLIVRKGTMIDAIIIQSGNRPLSNKKREELEAEPRAANRHRRPKHGEERQEAFRLQGTRRSGRGKQDHPKADIHAGQCA